MIGTYMGVHVIILGYLAERILVRYGQGKPFWVAAEYVK
jgi:hypothetical protein